MKTLKTAHDAQQQQQHNGNKDNNNTKKEKERDKEKDKKKETTKEPRYGNLDKSKQNRSRAQAAKTPFAWLD